MVVTGRELIEFIQRHNYEDHVILVGHRDSGGCYPGAEGIDPVVERVVSVGAQIYEEYERATDGGGMLALIL